MVSIFIAITMTHPMYSCSWQFFIPFFCFFMQQIAATRVHTSNEYSRLYEETPTHWTRFS
jgi:hypothetical protein